MSGNPTSRLGQSGGFERGRGDGDGSNKDTGRRTDNPIEGIN